MIAEFKVFPNESVPVACPVGCNHAERKRHRAKRFLDHPARILAASEYPFLPDTDTVFLYAARRDWSPRSRPGPVPDVPPLRFVPAVPGVQIFQRRVSAFSHFQR